MGRKPLVDGLSESATLSDCGCAMESTSFFRGVGEGERASVESVAPTTMDDSGATSVGINATAHSSDNPRQSALVARLTLGANPSPTTRRTKWLKRRFNPI